MPAVPAVPAVEKSIVVGVINDDIFDIVLIGVIFDVIGVIGVIFGVIFGVTGFSLFVYAL